MPNMRAIELTEKNLDVIANTGVISRADVQAWYEEVLRYETRVCYFVLDYVTAENARVDWVGMTPDLFADNLVFTEPTKTGFRHCKRK